MKKRNYGSEDFRTSKWSGGETTEFAICPESAKYIDRDFIWRLSSASVDVEESTFTKLPDYDRVLMVLEGEAILAHGAERTVKLGVLEQDSFSGDAGTKCFGKIRDYNLMFRKGCSGRLILMDAESEANPLEKVDMREYTNVSYGFYCPNGYAIISLNGESYMAGEGTQLVFDFESGEKADITVMGDGKVIVSEVMYTRLAHAAVEIPEEKATFEDFKTAFKLSKSRNKWKQAVHKDTDVWYDEALKSKLAFLDKSYIGMVLWVAVCIILVLLAVKVIPHMYAAVLIILWTIVYALVVSPLIYMIVLPKPIKLHIKSVDTLTEYEQKLYEKELEENSTTDNILNKYRHSGTDTWGDDYESVFTRIRKK